MDDGLDGKEIRSFAFVSPSLIHKRKQVEDDEIIYASCEFIPGAVLFNSHELAGAKVLEFCSFALHSPFPLLCVNHPDPGVRKEHSLPPSSPSLVRP